MNATRADAAEVEMLETLRGCLTHECAARAILSNLTGDLRQDTATVATSLVAYGRLYEETSHTTKEAALRDAVVAAAVACRHAHDYAHGPEDDAWIDLQRAVDAYEAASGGRG